ncbi:CDP-alcohol phosphatidyltransferase family protein [Alloactinosynnema sp. L-07]|uniref:CDP-alcohol phosphatidyltransferase family protein n=1 Tax=Alloactinosynnema sp. L-07 TaxID=1653480 RepID=UPI0006B5A8BA|nr:CDP-alcohol phosphatidyltransferase family protein [Alloactinosynnema sp. L-07]
MTTLQHSTTPVAQEHALWAFLQFMVLGALDGVTELGPTGWLAGLAYGVATWALLSGAMRRSGTVTLGPADRVTLLRGLLVGGVTALVVTGTGPTAVLVALAGIALALDFVDGQVARRTGTASALGARFDMEVDAFLILVLSVHVAFVVGPWALLIGVMRYAFVAASWALPWLSGPLSPSVARKAVAAAQGILLVVAASGVVPHAELLVGLALIALAASFGRDVLGLWTSRVASLSAPTEGCSYV